MNKMNKTKINFLSGLAMLELEAKAQEGIVKDLRGQLTKLDTAQDAINKLEDTVETHKQKQMIEAEVAELKAEITELDVTASDFVTRMMDIN
ncbi:hypothetical protein ABES35_08470 [Bacillus subtilis]|uniref:hypothetical protein n=1 Tax=Bacillus subtilis TaxID=1423 RepID=UPI000FFE29DA|nr:hypothetical protein [Bacillus subtilis]MEC2400917.1 hypothetical protein [Bacillus subtilis]MED4660650.1 hypothetical protein [Bacillus subtilis]MED4666238.1 hypothetical protein [Bacillus subtilis]NCT26201.1 hypothetical protein [Bacillus subtilis subsp. subtilis]QAT56932.1 hypothetical protein EQW70_05950 [Bacillus subtilis]